MTAGVWAMDTTPTVCLDLGPGGLQRALVTEAMGSV
jgi:hypothetical protein